MPFVHFLYSDHLLLFPHTISVYFGCRFFLVVTQVPSICLMWCATDER